MTHFNVRLFEFANHFHENKKKFKPAGVTLVGLKTPL